LSAFHAVYVGFNVGIFHHFSAPKSGLAARRGAIDASVTIGDSVFDALNTAARIFRAMELFERTPAWWAAGGRG
jgi:hypothetical protein